MAPHIEKLVSSNVTEIFQNTVPGDIRIDQFTIADPAASAASNPNRLELNAYLEKSAEHSSIKICVTNRGDKPFSLYPGIIEFLSSLKPALISTNA